jgi:hypothetical protein
MSAAQQPVPQARVARRARQDHGADRQNGGRGGVGIELASPAARQLANRAVEDVGVGELRRKRRPRHIHGECC